MKKKLLLTIITLFIFIPINISAEECHSSEIINERVYLNRLASNIDISSFYEITNNNINFSFRIANLHPDLYVIEKVKKLNLNYGNNKENPSEIIISGYRDAEVLTFEIYAKDTKCTTDELITTKYLTLPYYNKYYQEPVCNGLDNYYYCNKWSNVYFSYDKFVKTVEDYKKSLEQEPIIEEEPDNDTIIDLILNFLEDNYVYVLSGIIVISITTIIIKSRNKEFKF